MVSVLLLSYRSHMYSSDSITGVRKRVVRILSGMGLASCIALHQFPRETGG